MLGDDEIVPCGCGFDDVSFPHDCKTQSTHRMDNQAVTRIKNKDIGTLRQMIIAYIEQGRQLAKFNAKYAPSLIIPEERLNGFIEGLQVALKMIASIEKEGEING